MDRRETTKKAQDRVDYLQTHDQVFIIRLWLEAREISEISGEWRGVVEHIASGARRYFTHPDEIPPIISLYLDPPPEPAKE